MRLDIPDELISHLIDAINCYQDCCEGNRANVEEVWLIADDKTHTGGTYIHIAKQLQKEIGDPLRTEDQSLSRRDPQLQDLLHRMKMRHKHGPGNDAQ